MSELIRYFKNPVKIGTCQFLYYTTYWQYAKAYLNGYLSFQPGNDQPENYLNGCYLFRFPFPDEDQVRIGNHKPFLRSHLIQIPKHLEVSIAHEPHCEDKEPAEFLSLGIAYQKPVMSPEGEFQLQTAVRCPSCGGISRLDINEAKIIVSEFQHNTVPDKNDPTRTILARMMWGYRAKPIPGIKMVIRP